jgi:hypothetical protein
MQTHNGNILWNILFTRPMHDWERYEGEHKICWIPSKRKSFEVKSYYQVLSIPVQSTFPWKSIRKVKIPSTPREWHSLCGRHL